MNLFGRKLSMFGENDPKGVPEYLFFNALRMDYDSAQRANVSKQNYTVCPRLWYVDAVFVCRSCHEEFLFSANEQRFWYEDRRFYVDSLPKRCGKCRKADRTRLELKQRYDALISTALGACPLETKKEVAELIDELETAEGTIPDRMKENRSKLQMQIAKSIDQGEA